MLIRSILSLVLMFPLAAAAGPTCGDLVQAALEATHAGAFIARKALRQGAFTREIKSDGSLVTTADIEASAAIVETLTRRTGLPVFSEENPSPDLTELLNWNRFWVVDPIDGTENFANKGRDFSVLIALMERTSPDGPAKPILGVIGRPGEHKIYFGSRDQGSWVMNTAEGDLPMTRLLARRSTGDPVIATAQKGTQALIEASDLRERFDLKPIGGNGAKFIALASGVVDCYLAQPMKWWDIAAGDALYRYAVRDGEAPRESPLTYRARPDSLFYQERGFILGHGCADPAVHERISKILDRRFGR